MNINPIRNALDLVAEQLFGLSDALLYQIALNDAIRVDLPAPIRDAVASAPYTTRIQEYREVIRILDGDTAPASLDGDPSLWPIVKPQLPCSAGEIRCVSGVDLNIPGEPSLYSRPLLVLLDKHYVDCESEATDATGLWRAWVVSEFVEFAGWWDVALQGERRPQSCAMVQAWNRTLVAERDLGSRAYTLSASELAGVRAVWDEYAGGEDPMTSSDRQQGLLQLRETLGHLTVVTGVAGKPTLDVRDVFRGLYARAGETVAAVARERLAMQAPSTSAGELVVDELKKTWLRVKKFASSATSLPLSLGDAYAASTPLKPKVSQIEVLVDFEDEQSGTAISIVVFQLNGKYRVGLMAANANYLDDKTHLNWMTDSISIRREIDIVLLDMTPRHARDLCRQAATSTHEGRLCPHFTTNG